MQADPNFFTLVQMVLQFAVVPVVAFIWFHYRETQKHSTEIAVMQTQHTLVKENHDREFKEVKDSFRTVLEKLEEIQRELRK